MVQSKVSLAFAFLDQCERGHADETYSAVLPLVPFILSVFGKCKNNTLDVLGVQRLT